MTMVAAVPISVVILTHDEADNLAGCLDSLADVTDDVHIVDSGSSDGTMELAAGCGVQVHQHPFRGFGTQRNWAIDHVTHKYPWVFHLDADERFTAALAEEVANVIGATDEQSDFVGFYVANRLMLGGRWLRYAANYPAYQLRLFRLGLVRFENYGHGQRECTQGPLGYLRQTYIHLGFSKGIEAWFAKHATYAHRESVEAMASRQPLLTEIAGMFKGDRVQRRRAMKSLSYRLPMRPLFRWLHTIVIKRGLLDGRAGFTYARMLAIYEAMIAVEMRLARTANQDLETAEETS
jgi:glycosyltransferase involved in cell wall biosynthesis